MNGLISTKSPHTNDSEEHPNDLALYDFFTSGTEQINSTQRNSIAVHLTLCPECTVAGQAIKAAEADIADKLALPETEEDKASKQRSLDFVRAINANRQDAPIPPSAQPYNSRSIRGRLTD